MKRLPFLLLIAVLLGAAYLLPSVHAEETAAVKYTCPMHPQIISDHPGKCPICGMDLVPMENHEHITGESNKPVISLPADTIQKMGVRTEKAARSIFGTTLRATGTIQADERLRWDMASQAEGRVEELKFSAIGDHVKKGDLFYTLASTELQRFQSDYIIAARSGAQQAEGAARRLRLMGVDDRVVAELARTGKAFEHVPFYIPADGVLTRIEIRNGHYLKAGDEIGHIQDESTVWVDASLPEASLALVHDGDSATVIVPGSPVYPAKVEHIHPTIMEETRTGIARLVMGNPGEKLRPGSYVTVEFSLDPVKRLTVPSAAILRSSDGDSVIVAMGDGKFQARKVQAGLVSEGKTEIVSGLDEGEDVVSNGQFLIDSESNLRESLNRMKGDK